MNPARPLELDVRGRPVPQGSMTAFAVKNKTTGKYRGVVSQGGSKERRTALAEWRSAVRDSVFAALGVRTLEVPHFVEAPLAVEITFRLARPASHFGTGKNAGKLKPTAPPFPIGTPDVDKLARAVLDALKGTAFDDDSRVVDLHPTKVYSAVEGATVRVRLCTSIEEHLVLAPAQRGAFDHEEGNPKCPCVICECQNEDRKKNPNTRDESPTATPELEDFVDRGRAAQNRIREIIGGSQIEAELGVMGKSRASHVFERHAGRIRDAVQKIGDAAAKAIAPHLPPPQIKIDDSAAAAMRAGENEYRTRVLGQAPIPDRLSQDDYNGCDGEHAAPQCGSRTCYHRDPIDVAIEDGDRGELARIMLGAPAGSLEERRCLDALSRLGDAPPLEDDFG